MKNKPIDTEDFEAHVERHRRIIEELERQRAAENK
jgi:exonuclease VII small subunit